MTTYCPVDHLQQVRNNDIIKQLPYGILPSVMLHAFMVMTFARIEVLQYFENGIQLLACCIALYEALFHY